MASGVGRNTWWQRFATLILLTYLSPCLHCLASATVNDAEQSKTGSEEIIAGTIFFDGTVVHPKSDQADHAGTPGLNVNDSGWGYMDTSLKCGDDSMQLKAIGPGSSNFMLDLGDDAAPVWLDLVQPDCGYSIKSNPFGLVMVAPYHGCNMMQDDGYYVLLMRWKDTQVELCCPIRASPRTAPPLTEDPPYLNRLNMAIPINPDSTLGKLNPLKQNVFPDYMQTTVAPSAAEYHELTTSKPGINYYDYYSYLRQLMGQQNLAQDIHPDPTSKQNPYTGYANHQPLQTIARFKEDTNTKPETRQQPPVDQQPQTMDVRFIPYPHYNAYLNLLQKQNMTPPANSDVGSELKNPATPQPEMARKSPVHHHRQQLQQDLGVQVDPESHHIPHPDRKIPIGSEIRDHSLFRHTHSEASPTQQLKDPTRKHPVTDDLPGITSLKVPPIEQAAIDSPPCPAEHPRASGPASPASSATLAPGLTEGATFVHYEELPFAAFIAY